MDKGAHFYKCDFQVHSPRDINWTGATYGVTADQLASLTDVQKNEIINSRKQFAKEYLERVREKGLNAIAITDHHDVVFAKVIRQVAQEENAVFAQQNQIAKCVTVFPGIELTLDSPNCQSIILFDSDFPDNNLDSALMVLGVTPSDQFEKRTAQTTRIPMVHINDLTHLHKKLDELPYCRGRYIVLPNVNENGSFTIFRQGAQAHYKTMPCVGGYVDKKIPTGSGWKNKVDGGDPNYGNKPIGVISTSDNRHEDGREFGNYFTWVKWSEPSAEALRQACLAKESRISLENPDLPQISVTKIDVTNSRFLGSFSIEFNQQYNCLIGGRGTGKSTILEYLRWVICDQTISTGELDELTEIEKRRRNLIEKTLTQFEGEVRATFVLNGVHHIVKRNSVNNEISLKIGEGEFQRVTQDEVRRILPVQSYSQKQLSSVGITGEELKRFIQSPILNEIGNLNFELKNKVEQIKNSYSNLTRKKAIEKEIEQFRLEITSLSDQVENLRRSLTGISPEDQAIIARKPILDKEAGYVSSVEREIATIHSKIDELEISFRNFPEALPSEAGFENSELLTRVQVARSAKVSEIKVLITLFKEVLSPEKNAALDTLMAEWGKIKSDFDQSYEDAKSKTTSNQQVLIEIQRIEDRLARLQQGINERLVMLRDLGDPLQDFDSSRVSYWALHSRKAQLLHEQAERFQELSNGQIKVEVLKNIDIDLIKREMTRVLQGARIQSDKMQAILEGISRSDNPLEEWNQVLSELKALGEYNTDTAMTEAVPATPKLSAAGLNANNISKIAEVLNTENWLSLATMTIEFRPEFKYATNNEMEDEIPFSDASAGQQATALLTVLLNQPGAPLIIDQPEDDIDNRAIDEIIKNIWQAKKHRQLLFTSHNANLVVNGDAELVVCCDYRESGNRTRGFIKAEGAIDSKLVKQEITAVMEGGEKAFKLRKAKYGF